MLIRAGTIQDAQAISELIVPLAEKYIAYEFSPEGTASLLASLQPEAIRRYIEQGYRYFLAEENGELAAVAAARDNRHLYHLFVAEPFQRRGLARRLWTVVRDDCLRLGNPGAFTVNASRYAVEVYRKLGFLEAGPEQTHCGVISIPMHLGGAASE